MRRPYWVWQAFGRESPFADGPIESELSAEHRDHSGFGALLLQLLRHLKGDVSTKTVASDEIRPVRLNFSHLNNVMGRYRGDGCASYAPSVYALRLKRVEGLVSTHSPGEAM